MKKKKKNANVSESYVVHLSLLFTSACPCYSPILSLSHCKSSLLCVTVRILVKLNDLGSLMKPTQPATGETVTSAQAFVGRAASLFSLEETACWAVVGGKLSSLDPRLCRAIEQIRSNFLISSKIIVPNRGIFTVFCLKWYQRGSVKAGGICRELFLCSQPCCCIHCPFLPQR